MKTKMWIKGVGALSLLLSLGAAVAAQIPEAQRDFGMAPHEHYQHVLKEVFIDITVIGILFSIVALYFMFAYRRKSADQVGQGPKLSPQAILGWLILPSALFLADDIYLFAKGWDLHDHYRKVPANAYEIKLTGALWSWTYEYPNGVSTMNELVVPVDQPVLLRMTSIDVLHSHYNNKYQVTEDVVPGRVTYQWFLPTETGESVITCREYCGLMHSGMYGKLKVVSREEFDSWLTTEAASAAAQKADQESVVGANPISQTLALVN